MKGRNPESPPSAHAASAAGQRPSAADAYSALITPTKAVSEQQQQQLQHPSKKEKRQLQLTVENGTSGKVVLKKHKKKKSSEAAASLSASSTIKWPPVSSTKSLPPLSGRVEDLLRAVSQQQPVTNEGNTRSRTSGSGMASSASDVIEFEVNQECTSIGLVPSGRLAIAGFTDGTLRLFDLTGIFAKDKHHPDNNTISNSSTTNSKNKRTSILDELFDDDASSSEDSFQSNSSPTKNSSSNFLNSSSNQRYGAVACQIHARGVHTSLLMDVAVSEDGLYAFGGVQRGSVELAAVYLGDVEGYLDDRFDDVTNKGRKKKKAGAVGHATPGLLDLIHVDRHADAKLKGFGACTRLWNGWDRARNGLERPEYLLFTGKGIKNIHIWSYRPSRLSRNEESEWTCLYDTQTNGTSIVQLYFRHDAAGTLQAVSKSDDQKLRVWDLNFEQKRIAAGMDEKKVFRPKRPEYKDVASTEGTIGVCGPYAFASGSLGGMHNIINVVGLDADDVSSPFNCTELALPLADSAGGELYAMSTRPSRTGRQQRGDLKSVVHVAGLVFDASHALLQISDGSVVHYLHDPAGHPLLLQSPPSLCTTSIDDDVSFGASTNNQNKKMTLARVGSEGMVLFAVSSFNENTTRGALLLRALPGSASDAQQNVSKTQSRYWGFNGLKKKRKQAAPLFGALSLAGVSSRALSPRDLHVGTPKSISVGLVPVDSTPVPVTKSSKKFRDVSPAFLQPNAKISAKPDAGLEQSPVSMVKVIQNDSDMVNKVIEREVSPPPSEPVAKENKPSRSSKEQPSNATKEHTLAPLTKGDKNLAWVNKAIEQEVSSASSAPTAKRDKSSCPSKEQRSNATQDHTPAPKPATLVKKVHKGEVSQVPLGLIPKRDKSSHPSKKQSSQATKEHAPATLKKLDTITTPLKKASKGEVLLAPTESVAKIDLSIRPNKKRLLEDSARTPVMTIKCTSNLLRKVTPGDHLPAPSTEETITARPNMPNRSRKKSPLVDDSGLEQKMDSQLESIVQGSNVESTYSPKRSCVVDEKPSLKKQKITLGKKENDVPAKEARAIAAQSKEVEVNQKSLIVEKSPQALPNTPKKHGRKKTSSPNSSPVKDVDAEPAAPEFNNKKVGFLGITIRDKGSEINLPPACYQPRNEHSMLLVEQLPIGTVGDRLSSTPVVHSSFSAESTSLTESVHFKRQCDERQKIAAKHRAEHEMVRKKVLHTIRNVLSTWDIERDSNRSHASIVESAKKWFDEALSSHQELLNDMLNRQVMEAESLSASQTAELKDKRAPLSHVSFPFPEVFEQAQQEMLSFFSKK